MKEKKKLIKTIELKTTDWNVMEAEYFVKELKIGLKTTLLYLSIIIGSLRSFLSINNATEL